jgi:N-acetylglutamate synthase
MGIPMAPLNGVWPHAGAEPRVVASLLDRLEASGLPHCLQLPWEDQALAALGPGRGMSPAGEIPLMVLENEALCQTDSPSELTIRELDPVEARIHSGLAAGAFEEPREYFDRLTPPEILALEGLHCYVGEVDGRPVTTGLGWTRADSVGIFNIATLEECRGRGYGGAITARAVADGFGAGATTALLQSSKSGYGVYESLGFRTVGRWPCWISA